jgi:hypothetical protein
MPQLAGLGTSSSGKEYRFTDGDLTPGLYRYRLVDVSTEGVREIHPEKSIRIEAMPEELVSLRLLPVAPNPVKEEMQIAFLLPELTTVTLEIYSADGKLVATPLNAASRAAGSYSESIATSNLSPGAYSLRMIAGRQTRIQHFVVVR